MHDKSDAQLAFTCLAAWGRRVRLGLAGVSGWLYMLRVRWAEMGRHTRHVKEGAAGATLFQGPCRGG